MIATARAGSRADFRAGRMAAACAVATFVGVERERVLIATAPDGRPLARLRGAAGSRPAPVALSLTHRGGRAVAVAAEPGSRIGVDLERCGTVERGELRYFATPRERALGSLDPTLLWVLKEAAWKAMRCDDRLAFGEMELILRPDGVLRAISLRGVRVAATARVFRPWPRHIAAVVGSEGTGR